jgi:hypothetical protein
MAIRDEELEERIKTKLRELHDRIKWMADEDARSSWVGGFSAEGSALEEKERLIEETEKLLDELERQH